MKISFFLGAFVALSVCAFGQTAHKYPVGSLYVRDSVWVTYDTSYVLAAVAHPTNQEYSELRLIPAIAVGTKTHHFLQVMLSLETFRYYYLFGDHAGKEIRIPVLMVLRFPGDTTDNQNLRVK